MLCAIHISVSSIKTEYSPKLITAKHIQPVLPASDAVIQMSRTNKSVRTRPTRTTPKRDQGGGGQAKAVFQRVLPESKNPCPNNVCLEMLREMRAVFKKARRLSGALGFRTPQVLMVLIVEMAIGIWISNDPECAIRYLLPEKPGGRDVRSVPAQPIGESSNGRTADFGSAY